MTQNEFNELVSGYMGTLQIGTTAVTDKHFSLIRVHEDTVLTKLCVNGNLTDVRALYHKEGTGGTYKAQAFIIPNKLLGHKFFNYVDIDTGSGEGVLTDVN